MCGIAGIISTNPDAAGPALARMIDAQRHRGPDDGGHELYDLGSIGVGSVSSGGGATGSRIFVGIGNRRLAIQDLSPAGHQPMEHPATRDALVFNGELYNYPRLRQEFVADGVALRGHSDTEGLLHGLTKHGVAYLDRLEGMYAIAFLNRAKRTLLIARDPIGIKPLYVAWTRDAFLFASELRALLASGMLARKINRDAAISMVAYGAVQEPLTILEGVRAFPAGSFWEIPLDRGFGETEYKPRRFWSFPAINPRWNERDAVAELRRITEDAVRDHLISDVPVGVFLSSGLDSTAMASLAARHTSNLRTFTVSFADQPDMSEAALAAGTARIIGSKHQEVVINGPDALAAASKWIEASDQPSVDGLNTYVISKAVRDQGIIVALSGLGGDELFGGYSAFRVVPRFLGMQSPLRWIERVGARASARVFRRRLGARRVEKLRDLTRSGQDLRSLYLRERRILSDAEFAALGLDLKSQGLPAGGILDAEPTGDDAIADISRLESRLYMGNTLLRDSDVHGMAHSLELRVPLLDKRLLDFAYSLPGAVRLPRGRAGKHLMRQAFAEFLRPELLQQKKRGFSLPVGRWMLGPLRELCESGLRELQSLELFQFGAIEATWAEFVRTATGNHWTTPMAFVSLGLFARRLTGR